jgi:hypothetical protein
MTATYLTRGWCRFSYDEALRRWIDETLPDAREAVTSALNAEWHRCGGTWFVGVNALPNDARGAVPGGAPIAGRAVDFIRSELGMTGFGWDSGQVSVVYPGYPQPEKDESPAAFRFRCERDAAHIDGVLREGPKRRRFLRQYHEFILGIPMVPTTAGMSPVVVWEGSHEIVRSAFREFYGKTSPASWPNQDVTELYRRVRRTIFERCKRVELTAQPGEAYLLHRLTLHGIAPWRADEAAGSDGRMIVYFRPDTGTPESWLCAP